MIPILAAVLLTAACGGATTLSSSSTKDRPAPVGAVGLNGGANAGSTSDITNRPNPPVHNAGTGVVKPLTPSSKAPPASAVPAFGSAVVDRCGMAIDTGVAGNRGTPRFGTHLPKLMCAVE